TEIAFNWGLHSIGFEANDLSFATYKHFAISSNSNGREFSLIPTERMIESIRSLKDSEEIKLISKAVKLSDSVFEQVSSTVKEGMTEKEVAWQIERLLRDNGSETIPFEIIVASGPRSALPHAKPTERIIRAGEPVIIDMGAKVEGYCSDLSRTICLGPDRDPMFSKIYGIVYRAQAAAIEGIQAGMSAKQADNIARSIIEQYGYGTAFGHSLGHGIGLAPHESPSVSPVSENILSDTMVFTIEPGIYLTGWGGVRIEDTTVMENGKVRILSKANKLKPQGEA
ncbi:MAG: aminopeptidase P family protein, partial [Dehalococcoidia bacterium]|nr:aminopeptidase P family protein [Dehalococcoidia bacterium]